MTLTTHLMSSWSSDDADAVYGGDHLTMNVDCDEQLFLCFSTNL